jgi:hypothetical protein
MTTGPHYGANLSSSTLNFMTDLINLLQTLALVLTLILVIFVLGWIVYAFRKFVVLFNRLIEEIERPRCSCACRTDKATAPAIVPAPPQNQSVEEEAEVPDEQYHCGTCDAKLPKIPKHSVIKDEISILVFKCRRCGKETEVDPAKGQPK